MEQNVFLLLLIWTGIVFSAYKLYQNLVLSKYVKVTATVTGMDSYMSRNSRGGGNVEVFNPEFTYEWNGWKRTTRPVAYASFWKYQIGDEAVIYVNPEKAVIWGRSFCKTDCPFVRRIVPL